MPEGLNTNSNNKAGFEKDIANLENDKAEAEMMMEGAKVGEIENQISELKKKLESLGEDLPSAEITPNETVQVENMGGDQEKVKEATIEIDQKIAGKDEEIKDVEKVTEEKVKDVKIEKSGEVNLEELKAKIKGAKERLLLKNSGVSFAEKAEIYNSLGQAEEAKNALETDAKDNEEKGYLGWAADSYGKLGNKEKANDLYKQEITKLQERMSTEKDFKPYNLLGDIYEKLGDLGKSQEMYNKLISEFETKGRQSDISLDVVAGAYEKLGDTEKAKKVWENSAERWGESKADRAALRYEKAGDKEKSEEFYKKAISYQEGLENPDYSILAKSYAALGDKQKAIEILTAQAENPNINGERYYLEMENYLK